MIHNDSLNYSRQTLFELRNKDLSQELLQEEEKIIITTEEHGEPQTPPDVSLEKDLELSVNNLALRNKVLHSQKPEQKNVLTQKIPTQTTYTPENYFQTNGSNINPDAFSKEAIEKVFSNTKNYKIRFYDEQATTNTGIIANIENTKTSEQIQIRNKNGEITVSKTQTINYQSENYSINNNGDSAFVEKNGLENNSTIISQEFTYDKDGNIIKYSDNIDKKLNYLDSYSRDSFIKSLILSGVDLSQKKDMQEHIFNAIIDEIYKTNMLGLPEKADNLAFLILNHINEENIEEFLKYYEANNKKGETFLESLSWEALNLLTKNKIKNYIQDTLQKWVTKSYTPTAEKIPPVNDNGLGTKYPAFNDDLTNVKSDQTSTIPSQNKNKNITSKQPQEIHIELQEIEVVGTAGKDVCIIDGHSFKPMTNENGETYYQVYTPEGKRYIISKEDYETYIHSNPITDVSKVLENHATIANTTNDFTVSNSTTTQKQTDKNIEFEKTKTSLAQNAPTASSIQLATNTGWQGTFGQSIINNYGNSNGTIDTDSLINDWSNNGGQVYSYTGSAAQKAFKDLQNGTWNAGTNYNPINSGYNSGNAGNYTGGFDALSIGGNPYGGGIVYNQYGQIDYKNSWFSFGSSGGGNDMVHTDADGNEYANPFDRINKNLMQVDQCQ